MNRTVLVVDDDPASLRILEHHLVATGFNVLKASNGTEALKIVLAEDPPIVITDWHMPEMDGLTLCKTLREHEGVRFVYIIMITVESDSQSLVKAFEAGADDFIAKPINSQEFLARFRAAERICKLDSDIAKRTMEIHRLNAEMAIANDKLIRMATTDELTGLMNRREAMNRLNELWSMRDRSDHPFSCIMLDIDHFKKVNDTHGHACGDVILREMGTVMRGSVRMADIVCRMGGEEFLVLCPGVEVTAAGVCAEHIRAAIEAHGFYHGTTQLKVTVSLGVAEPQADTTGPDALIRHADEALYQAKRTGRNRVVVYEGAASRSVSSLA